MELKGNRIRSYLVLSFLSQGLGKSLSAEGLRRHFGKREHKLTWTAGLFGRAEGPGHSRNRKSIAESGGSPQLYWTANKSQSGKF